MRGSAAFRVAVAPGGALAGPWVQNSLWTRARALPSLDLRFDDNKSLTDAVTGAQLVTHTRASSGTYVGSDGLIKSATTNEPRFDHNPTTGESLGLLVEEAGTNLLLSSEEFDSASWLGAVLTANTQVAPNGTTTADTLTATPGTPSFYQTVTCTASTAYTFSFYVKLGTMPASDFRFAIRDDTAGAFIATNIVPNVTPVTTEWRRVTYTLTTPVGCLLLRVYPYRSTIITGGTAFFWGAQLEAGAFATSYIPTTTATVTRAADVASITGSNFSSWYNQTEGTVFADYEAGPGVASRRTLSINDATAGNVIQLITSNTNGSASNYSEIVTLGVSQGSLGTGTAYAPVRQTSALAYVVNNVGFAKNGGAASVDLTVSIPAVTRLEIGSNLSATSLNGHIRRLTYWPQRLSNEVLQRITQ